MSRESTTRPTIDRRVALGMILGATGALAAGVFRSRRTLQPGRLLSDVEGRFDELVVQYVPRAASIVTETYKEFFSALDRDVRVYVAVPSEDAFTELTAAIGPVRPALIPVVTGHAMSTWSRDRWLALSHGPRDTTLLAPAAENAARNWPQRAGDQQIATDLAHELPHVRTVRAELLFDGGDFVADAERVFVAPRMVERNTNGTASARTELRVKLEDVLGRNVVLLERGPLHHAGMFLMPIGDRRAFVGDPSLAAELVAREGHDFSDATQALFDAVAARLTQEGYEVTRMPVAPGLDGRTYETPLNAVLADATVYMPTYAHAPQLNAEATRIWEEAGYTVVGIDCTNTFTRFGSLRCLVNVLRRA